MCAGAGAAPLDVTSQTRALGLIVAAHLLLVCWVFAGPLFQDRLPFFRDVSAYYFPNYVFLESSFAKGVWPLFNPAVDAGSRYLNADPMDLLMVAAFGARGALRFSSPCHMLIAMAGVSFLARVLGQRSWGAWLAGAVYGLSGFYQSTFNLFELNHGASWAPWAIGLFLRAADGVSWRRAAGLALLAALQTCTLAAEILLQTAIAALVLLRRMPDRSGTLKLAVAGFLAACLSAPATLGALNLTAGTQRAHGFSREVALGWSANPPVLVEMLLPHFFGDVHTFTNEGFWGQPFFSSGFPYLLSLYFGLCVLIAAIAAGRGYARIWLLVALGIALSLGASGPLAPVMGLVMRSFRTPVKFMFLAALGMALLAGFGIDRAGASLGRPPRWLAIPGLVLLVAGAILLVDPRWPPSLLGGLLPALTGPNALDVARVVWPSAFILSGLLACGCGALLSWTRRTAPLAATLIVLDLLIVGEGVNPSTDARFYALEPAVETLVKRLAPGDGRWFSFGFANAPGVHVSPVILEANRDVWLYYFDRQSLLPRTHVLDGLEGAFDEDRVGWAPPGSTLPPTERVPSRYSALHRRLWLSGVRYVLSLVPISDERLREAGRAVIDGLFEPLRAYEIVEALPRAFFVPEAAVVDASSVAALIESPDFDPRKTVLLTSSPEIVHLVAAQKQEDHVAFREIDPHTIAITADTPPGYLVLLEGFDPGWTATSDGCAVPLMKANGRYQALATSGGPKEFLLAYRPSWRNPALALLVVGLLGTTVLLLLPKRSSEPS